VVVTGDTSRSDTSNLLVSPVTATAQTQPQPHATLLRTLEQHQGAINYFSRALNANQGLGVGTHWDVICRERERESYAQPGLGRPVTGVWVKGGPVCNRALP
jgi:hypothetical protein